MVTEAQSSPTGGLTKVLRNIIMKEQVIKTGRDLRGKHLGSPYIHSLKAGGRVRVSNDLYLQSILQINFSYPTFETHCKLRATRVPDTDTEGGEGGAGPEGGPQLFPADLRRFLASPLHHHPGRGQLLVLHAHWLPGMKEASDAFLVSFNLPKRKPRLGDAVLSAVHPKRKP